MADTPLASLRKSPLDATHRALSGLMVDCAGWDLPFEYSGVADEHIAVRTRAGLFDLSHLGEIEIAGREALAAVQRLLCNDASVLRVGQVHYSALLTPAGTFLDDVLVYRMAASHFLLVVNAANVGKAHAWILEQLSAAADVAVVDASSRYAVVAIQGPASQEVLQPLTAVDLDDLRRWRFTHGEVASARAIVSRTGYTGEDGFEIFIPPNMAVRVWDALRASGRAADVVPCGFGAGDTLRLEAGLRLHGRDIDELSTVLEAGLEPIIGWRKAAFIGRDQLVEQKARGVRRRLVGFELAEPGVAAHGDPVLSGSTRRVGVVTSGARTPYLDKSIGMAYVPPDLADPGTPIAIEIRGRETQARVVALPFYTRARGRD